MPAYHRPEPRTAPAPTTPEVPLPTHIGYNEHHNIVHEYTHENQHKQPEHIEHYLLRIVSLIILSQCGLILHTDQCHKPVTQKYKHQHQAEHGHQQHGTPVPNEHHRHLQ